MVVAVIVIIAAIAMAVLERARHYAAEGSALGSMRTINSAQSAYAAACGGGFYAPSLAALGTAPDAAPGAASAGEAPDGASFGGGGLAGAAFVAEGLNTDPSYKSTYTITLYAGPNAPGSGASCNGVPAGAAVYTYFVGADPPPADGTRFFGTSQAGTIYRSETQVPITFDGAPAGAAPIE